MYTTQRRNLPWLQIALIFFVVALIGAAIGMTALGGAWHLPAIVLAAGLAFVLFLPRPALLFAIYCLSIPFESVLVLAGWEGVTLTRYLGIGSGVLLVIHLLMSKRINMPPPALLVWGAFFCWGAASIFWAIAPEQATQSWLIHVRFLVLYAVIVFFPFSQRDVEAIRKAIIAAGVLAGIYILYFYGSPAAYLGAIRASIAWGDHAADPNHTAAALLLPFSLLLSAAISAKRPKLIIHLLPLAIMFLAIVLTGSRTGLLGLAVASVSLFFMYFGSQPQQRARIVGFVALGAIAIWQLWPMLPAELLQRFVLAEVVAGGGAGRLDIWEAGIAAWLANPILGYGFGSFGAVQTLWAGHLNTAHNIYLQALVELGVLGPLLLVAALALSLRMRPATTLERGATAGFLAMLVASLFLGTLNYDYFWLTLMVVEVARRVHMQTTDSHGERVLTAEIERTRRGS